MDVIWSNYSDLTRPHPKWWFSKGNPLISGKSRLVKYYNLARCNYMVTSSFTVLGIWSLLVEITTLLWYFSAVGFPSRPKVDIAWVAYNGEKKGNFTHSLGDINSWDKVFEVLLGCPRKLVKA